MSYSSIVSGLLYRRIGWGVAIAAVLLGCLLPFSALAVGKRIALCVGVDAYAEEAALKHAAGDAEAIGAALARRGFDNTEVVTDSDATRSGIEQKLAALIGSVSSDDTVVFFFAGHGQRVGIGERSETYLVPYGCSLEDADSEGISVGQLGRALARLNGATVIVMLDACYSGARLDEAFGGLSQGGSALVLAAGRSQEMAYESDTENHGIFTHSVLRSLKRGGIISGGDFAQGVAKAVAMETGGWQRPVYRLYGVDSAGIVL